ncbi:hypothetical protein J2X77_002196 [Sphingobacterium sp. 2149]|nr:hypothetical protein [Sphingobacterium sp. UBA1498]MDR6735328.1 hypothetical protein [Sphingobacterium sp. 2149]
MRSRFLMIGYIAAMFGASAAERIRHTTKGRQIKINWQEDFVECS